MIAFEIDVDGQRACRIGLGEGVEGVLSAVLTWVGRRASDASRDPRYPIPREELFLTAGGLRALGPGIHDREVVEAHTMRWLYRAMGPGSELSIRVVEASEVDPPVAKTYEELVDDWDAARGDALFGPTLAFEVTVGQNAPVLAAVGEIGVLSRWASAGSSDGLTRARLAATSVTGRGRGSAVSSVDSMTTST